MCKIQLNFVTTPVEHLFLTWYESYKLSLILMYVIVLKALKNVLHNRESKW